MHNAIGCKSYFKRNVPIGEMFDGTQPLTFRFQCYKKEGNKY